VFEGGYAVAEVGVNAVNVLEGFGPGLSRQARQAGHRLPGGRPDRHHHAPAGRQRQQDPRPAGDRRQQAGRRRHAARAGAADLAPRRLHAGADPAGRVPPAYTTKINWDPVKDISYVINVTGYAFGIVVPADSPFKNWKPTSSRTPRPTRAS
jgi:hypothetical protein